MEPPDHGSRRHSTAPLRVDDGLVRPSWAVPVKSHESRSKLAVERYRPSRPHLRCPVLQVQDIADLTVGSHYHAPRRGGDLLRPQPRLHRKQEYDTVPLRVAGGAQVRLHGLRHPPIHIDHKARVGVQIPSVNASMISVMLQCQAPSCIPRWIVQVVMLSGWRFPLSTVGAARKYLLFVDLISAGGDGKASVHAGFISNDEFGHSVRRFFMIPPLPQRAASDQMDGDS